MDQTGDPLFDFVDRCWHIPDPEFPGFVREVVARMSAHDADLGNIEDHHINHCLNWGYPDGPRFDEAGDYQNLMAGFHWKMKRQLRKQFPLPALRDTEQALAALCVKLHAKEGDELYECWLTWVNLIARREAGKE